MDEVVVTIGGQRVHPKGEAPNKGQPSSHPDLRDAAGHPLATSRISPASWVSREAVESGWPYLTGLVAVLLLMVIGLVLAKRSR